MTANATTRAARTAIGKCAVCLKRPANDGHATCRTCRKALAVYHGSRYSERRKAKQCVKCGEPANGYLCEPHAEARRKSRTD